MPTSLRFLAFQLPGWVLVAILLWAAVRLFDLPVWLAWAVALGNVVKDLILYPWLRRAYSDDPSPFVGVDGVIGAEAVVEDELAPIGHVRVRNERWRAMATAGENPIPAGTAVRVLGARGLTLVVETLASETAAPAPPARSGGR